MIGFGKGQVGVRGGNPFSLAARHFGARGLTLCRLPLQSLRSSLLEHSGMARPLGLHIPHSSRQIPTEERARFLLEDAELDAELLRMTDAFTDELFPFTNAEAGRVVYGVSRLLCDPERFSEDVLEPMAAKGMGALYVKTSDGRALRKTIEAQERHRLMDLYYHPHHLRLESLVRKTLESEGCCIVVDCHSFANRPYPHEFDQAPHRPDICIGTDSYHTPHWLRDIALQSVQRHGRSVQVNRPFAGALVPMAYYAKEPRVLGIMIEINRSLYMVESTGIRIASWSRVANEMTLLMEAIGQEWEAHWNERGKP